MSKKAKTSHGRRRPFSDESVPCQVCGNPKRETQCFCYACFSLIPLHKQYEMQDGDSATRSFARADAQHFLENKLRIQRGPERPLWLDPVPHDSQPDRKTISAGE